VEAWLIFLLGLLAAIPLAVGANLLTPRVGEMFAGTSTKRKERFERRAAAWQDDISQLRSEPIRLTHFLLVQVPRATLLGSIGGLIASQFLFLGFGGSVFSLVGQLVSVFTALLVVNICLNALRVWRDVSEHTAETSAANQQRSIDRLTNMDRELDRGRTHAA
jgi:hypothetical protein